MLSRIYYAVRTCEQYKLQLKDCVRDPALQLSSVLELTPAVLIARGVNALVLDFDGVLASHAEPKPRVEVESWLQNFCQKFVGRKIYLLSNKPTQERLNYFKQRFPDIIFIIAKRKKPYPDGLQQVIHDSQLQPAQVLLVDDRLATGIIAAISTGVQYIWITQPYTNFAARPIRESWFALLRGFEKFCVRHVKA